MGQVGLRIQLAAVGLSHIVGKMVILELIPVGSLNMQRVQTVGAYPSLDHSSPQFLPACQSVSY